VNTLILALALATQTEAPATTRVQPVSMATNVMTSYDDAYRTAVRDGRGLVILVGQDRAQMDKVAGETDGSKFVLTVGRPDFTIQPGVYTYEYKADGKKLVLAPVSAVKASTSNLDTSSSFLGGGGCPSCSRGFRRR
jgi:hypothetical protein